MGKLRERRSGRPGGELFERAEAGIERQRSGKVHMTDDTTHLPACESCGLIVPHEFRVAVMNERMMYPHVRIVDRAWGSCANDGTRDRWICTDCIEGKTRKPC